MSDDDTRDPFTIVDAVESSRFELRDDDALIGFARYRDRQDRDNEASRVFIHTEIDDAYEGRGLGSRLARHVLEDAVAGGRRIVPLCPFIAAYLRRHHDFDDNVDWPDAVGDPDGGSTGAPA